jgi:hypothetical protein
MTRHGTIGALCPGLLLVILPGCGEGDADDAGGTTDTVPPAPVAAGTESTAGAPLPDEPMPWIGGSEVTVNRSAQHTRVPGRQGRPLYLFTADTAGVSTCYGPCAARVAAAAGRAGHAHSRIRGGGRAAARRDLAV